jgi:predicted RNA polymerase sigma factor
MISPDELSHRVVDQVARESYGRLIALLAARTGDVAGAEDALSDALVAALVTWPRSGVPKNPPAWLLTSARNRLADAARHRRVRSDTAHTLVILAEQHIDPRDPPSIPDERLKLLFACAHPAIDCEMHTPLMLQTVLGLDADSIGRAFLVSPSTMGQRLVRAKLKIRKAGIPFVIPDSAQLPDRLDAVMSAVYAAYGYGWDDVAGADRRAKDLAQEAIWLARVLRELAPDEPESHGLLALMLYCESRRLARRSAAGQFARLSSQDARRWSTEKITEAERELAAASRYGRPGRYQIEAAIQSALMDRARSGTPHWDVIVTLYNRLYHLAPTIGASVGRAAALGELRGPAEGLAALDQVSLQEAVTYQPYWAVRGHMLLALGRSEEAKAAFDRAIGLTHDDSVRQFLLDARGVSK